MKLLIEYAPEGINNFHNSDPINLIIDVYPLINKSQYRKVYNHFCGIADCRCSAGATEQINEDGTLFRLNEKYITVIKKIGFIELDNWCLTYYTKGLVGQCYYHPYFGFGETIVTSELIRINKKNIITTESGSKYVLLEPKPDYEKQFPNAKERLYKVLRKKT